jgi:dTDP-4-dehydrorhamnose reductase
VRVLFLGGDTPLGFAMRAFIAPLQRHTLLSVDMSATRWRRERQVKKLLRATEPDLILDGRALPLMWGRDRVGQPDLDRTHWLARLCQRYQKGYLHLSSALVFSGDMSRPYKEQDTPDARDEFGQILAAWEREVMRQVEDAFVLRLGQPFAGRRSNNLAAALDHLRSGKRIEVSDRYQGSPVHVAEVARVVCGVLDQMSVGAPRKGLYHYCSEGMAGAYTFVEAVVACASQYEEFKNARDLLTDTTDPDKPIVNHTLDCAAIRHEFGIQQLPWRDFVERAIQRYRQLYIQ